MKTGDAAVSALRAAPDAAADAGTAQFEMVMEMAVMGESLEIVATGAFDAAAEQMSMTMDMGALFEQLAGSGGEDAARGLGDGAVEFVADGDTFYMRVAAVRDAHRHDRLAVDERRGPRHRAPSGLGLGAGTYDPTKMLESLRGVTGEPEVVGQEDVRGVRDHPLPRHHEPGRRARARCRRTSGRRSRPRSSSSATSETAEIPVDIWIDGDDLPAAHADRHGRRVRGPGRRGRRR